MNGQVHFCPGKYNFEERKLMKPCRNHRGFVRLLFIEAIPNTKPAAGVFECPSCHLLATYPIDYTKDKKQPS
jgi:hypothetical protein